MQCPLDLSPKLCGLRPIVIFMNGAHFVEDDYQSHIDRLEQSKVWKIGVGSIAPTQAGEHGPSAAGANAAKRHQRHEL